LFDEKLFFFIYYLSSHAGKFCFLSSLFFLPFCLSYVVEELKEELKDDDDDDKEEEEEGKEDKRL